MGEVGRSPEQERKFIMPMGFSDAAGLGGEPATVGEYLAKGLTGAEPGKYAQNNGTLALVTSEGRIGVWIPKENPSEPRAVSYEKAIQNLKDAGYTEGNFYVPFSNGN